MQNIYTNSPGFDSTDPTIKRITIRDLVLRSMSVRLNFFGLGGVYNAYIQSKPVSLGFLNHNKGSNSPNPVGAQPLRTDVDVRTARATTVKTNKAGFRGI